MPLIIPGAPGQHIDPPTGQPQSSSAMQLPSALTGLGDTLKGLDITLGTQAAVTQELLETVKTMMGRQAQTNSSIPSVPQPPSSPSYDPNSSTESTVAGSLIGADIGTRWHESGSPFSTIHRPRTGAKTVESTFQVPLPGGGFVERTRHAEVVSEGGVPTVGGVRHHASKFISERQWGPQLVNLKNPVTGETELHNVAEGRLATDAEKMTSQRMNAAKSLLGNAVSGGGLPGIGELASLVPEVAVPLGIGAAVLGTGYEVGHMIEDQRAKNAQFQSVLGGTNASGFGQRLDELGFRASMFGTMNGAMANEAFMGTTQMGLQGGQRQGALDAITTQYKNLGMSVSQSLQAMNVQLEAGNDNFQQLTQSLTEVSAAAESAGVNANVARQAFISNLSSVQSSVGGGVGSTTSASGLTNAFTKFGRSLGLNAQDAGALSDQRMLMQIAAKNGMNYDDVVTRANSDPGWLSQQATGIISRYAGNVAPKLNTDLHQILAQHGWQGAYDRNQLSTSQQEIVNNSLLNKFPNLAQIMPQAIQAATGQSMNLNPLQFMQLFAGAASGQLEKNAAVGNPFSTSSLTDAQRKDLQQGLAARQDINAGRAGEVKGSAPNTGSIQSALKAAGINIGTINGSEGWKGTRIQYAEELARGGANSGIIDQLLRNGSDTGWGQEFQVKNAQGKDEKVSFAQLMANKNYQQQAAAGTASIYGKNGTLTTLADQYAQGAKITGPTQKVDVNLKVSYIGGAEKIIRVVQSSSGSQASAYTLTPPPSHNTPGNDPARVSS